MAMIVKETKSDSEIIGDQIGTAVNRMTPAWIRQLDMMTKNLPTDFNDPKTGPRLAMNLAGFSYLQFWGYKMGKTAVKFQSMGENIVVGNDQETRPGRIINWNDVTEYSKVVIDNFIPKHLGPSVFVMCLDGFIRFTERVAKAEIESNQKIKSKK